MVEVDVDYLVDAANPQETERNQGLLQGKVFLLLDFFGYVVSRNFVILACSPYDGVIEMA